MRITSYRTQLRPIILNKAFIETEKIRRTRITKTGTKLILQNYFNSKCYKYFDLYNRTDY
jgi:hypothetical protein